MKVLHIITGLNGGGAERALQRLVTADRVNTHAVVSLMDEGVIGGDLRANHVPLHTLGLRRGRLTVRAVRTLSALIRDFSPDVVQTWMYHADLLGGVVARVCGRRVVWSVRASDAHVHSNWAARAIVWLCARLSRAVPTRVVYASSAGMRVHESAGYAPSKSRWIPNGFDTQRLRPDPIARERLRREWGISAATTVIGTVARWDPLKDHATLFKALTIAAGRRPDARPFACVLAGSGMTSANGTLASLLQTAGLTSRIRLLGPVTDIAAVMNALDLHILSSCSEGFPNVVGEAMACGTPCVSTDVGDAAAIVGSTGWIVPAGAPDLLAAAIGHAVAEMEDTVAWQRRQHSTRERIVDVFGIDRMLSAYRSVWAEAAAV